MEQEFDTLNASERQRFNQSIQGMTTAVYSAVSAARAAYMVDMLKGRASTQRSFVNRAIGSFCGDIDRGSS